MSEETFFLEQLKLVFKSQKNKRRSRGSIEYESNIIALTVRAMYKRFNKELRINRNYSFLVSRPKWREIMTTEFEGLKIDHEICQKIIPVADKVLSPYTFNNRVGKGTQAAINQVIDYIYEVTQGYIKPARVIKLDFKNYFPNALWDFAEKCINGLIDLLDEPEEIKNYLRWLTMISINCNPAEHCELRTPKRLWDIYIDPEKSIFTKPLGVGAAIGRLIWQISMGLYINDIIVKFTHEYNIKFVCFVDDIVLIVPEENHQHVLNLIPELRKDLANINIKLNEKKFYDQPYQNGLEFLGSHIKPYRIHLNNSTYNNALERIREFNKQSYKDIDELISVFNSYSGLLKSRTDYKRLIKLKNLLSPEWFKYVEFDDRRLCLVYNKKYSINMRLNRKYNLKLKGYDKNGNRRVHKRPDKNKNGC